MHVCLNLHYNKTSLLSIFEHVFSSFYYKNLYLKSNISLILTLKLFLKVNKSKTAGIDLYVMTNLSFLDYYVI